MEVHLIDGTYELFRHFYAVPSAKDVRGQEIGAVRAVLHSMLTLTREGATHIGVATDHVIESFRNELWSEYKTGEGIDPDLLGQFSLLEKALTAVGIVVWPMIEFEADDAMASAANAAAQDKRVDRILICTPDKDLAQCVRGTRIVQFDRRKRALRDEAGVIERFGVGPPSIPDYLALVGDAADGYPGLKGWGTKSAAAVLSHFKHLEYIPLDASEWRLNLTNPAALAKTFAQERDKAFLFRDLATLRTEIALFESVDDLLWSGPTSAFPLLAARLDSAVTAKNAGGRPGRVRHQGQGRLAMPDQRKQNEQQR
jgi:5'-3' exonuclease